jgi:hypothetical protein
MEKYSKLKFSLVRDEEGKMFHNEIMLNSIQVSFSGTKPSEGENVWKSGLGPFGCCCDIWIFSSHKEN